MRTFRVAALNIVMPVPHSAERYIDLLRVAYRRRRIVRLRGDYAGMIGALAVHNDIVSGQFYKFFDLDETVKWFNLSSQQEAEPEDLAQIKVPNNLKPHFQSLGFVFFPRRHRLVFVCRDGKETLSPNLAKALLDRIFVDARIVEGFGEIDITVEPQREQLRRIFAMARLKRLTIEVTPPNPDDLDDAEAEVYERMSGERAQRMTIDLVSKHPKGLSPDEDHKMLAKVAQSNGKVMGRGQDQDGATVELSTKDHPLIAPVLYDPNMETRGDALEKEARAIVHDIQN